MMSDTVTEKPTSPQPLGLSLHDQLGPLPESWYCVSKDGRATLCTEEADAIAEARLQDDDYPNAAPHRALVLGDVAAERERCAAIAESWATDETATTCANVAAAIRGA